MRRLARPGPGILVLALIVALALAVACGPAATPTPTPKPTPTPTPTAAPLPTATPTPTKAAVATPTPTAVPATPTPVPSIKPTGTVKHAASYIGYLAGVPEFCGNCSANVKIGLGETLFEVERDASGALVAKPMLGLSYDIAPDLSYVDVKLRQGVKFNLWDPAWGENELTAEDVVWSFNNANATMNPKSVADTGGDIGAALGTKGMEALDKYTVRINFQSFWSHAQVLLFSMFWEAPSVFSKKAYDALGPDKMRATAIQTGPFELVEWTTAKVTRVKAVENHWRKTPYVAAVEAMEVPEPSARKAMLETGEVHISVMVVKDQKPMLDAGFKRAPGAIFYSRNALSFPGNYWEKTHYVTGKPLNYTLPDKPWVGNPDDPASMERARKVRWALSMAIDREGINQSVFMGLGRPYGMYELSVDDPIWQDKWKIPYDPAGAKKLLTEAGYPDGFECTLWSGPSGDEVTLMEAVAATWLKDLNVRCTIDKGVYGATIRPKIIDRTNTTIWRCGDGNSQYPGTWPKGLLLSSLAAGGYSCNNDDPFYAKNYMEMAKTTDPAKLKTLATNHFEYLYQQRQVVGMPENPGGLLYNPKKIIEWKMYPEGKAWIFDGFNSPEWIKLAP